ncbi:MAG: hypothetical protein L7T84_13750, partial [Akkermansiaceae bacterium]|nr:hypothetical protein [Akkermansiaceae bacterium]
MIKSLIFLLTATTAYAQIAVKADLLFPMTGDLKPIKNAIVLCGPDGKIQAVGSDLKIPAGYHTITAK